MPKLKINRQVATFITVGIINTAVDLSVYLTLLAISNSIIIANVAATTTALIVSYILNNQFTFKRSSLTLNRFLLFLLVTIFGLWVLQTAAIYGFTMLIDQLPTSLFNWLGNLSEPVQTILPKLLATAISLVWNYIWYSRVIFKDTSSE